MVEAGESAVEPAVPAKRAFLRRRWVKTTLLTTGLVVLLIAGLLFLRKNAPPEAARLLPESDGIVYVDVAPMRAVVNFNAHPVQHDPDYQHFIDSTGIQFERDLDEAAFATHRMSNPLGPNGPVAFSSIFVGRFDHTRLETYLEGLAQSKERYAGHDIYNIAIDGRVDRVAILGSNKVAVSNTPTAEQIHSILDRQRTALCPFPAILCSRSASTKFHSSLSPGASANSPPALATTSKSSASKFLSASTRPSSPPYAGQAVCA